jgi:hypothetical protein
MQLTDLFFRLNLQRHLLIRTSLIRFYWANFYFGWFLLILLVFFIISLIFTHLTGLLFLQGLNSRSYLLNDWHIFYRFFRVILLWLFLSLNRLLYRRLCSWDFIGWILVLLKVAFIIYEVGVAIRGDKWMVKEVLPLDPGAHVLLQEKLY